MIIWTILGYYLAIGLVVTSAYTLFSLFYSGVNRGDVENIMQSYMFNIVLWPVLIGTYVISTVMDIFSKNAE